MNAKRLPLPLGIALPNNLSWENNRIRRCSILLVLINVAFLFVTMLALTWLPNCAFTNDTMSLPLYSVALLTTAILSAEAAYEIVILSSSRKLNTGNIVCWYFTTCIIVVALSTRRPFDDLSHVWILPVFDSVSFLLYTAMLCTCATLIPSRTTNTVSPRNGVNRSGERLRSAVDYLPVYGATRRAGVAHNRTTLLDLSVSVATLDGAAALTMDVPDSDVAGGSAMTAPKNEMRSNWLLLLLRRLSSKVTSGYVLICMPSASTAQSNNPMIYRYGSCIISKFIAGRTHRLSYRLRRALKIIGDRILATAILGCIIPLLLLIAVAVKLESPGPCVYRQQRCGMRGKPFQILKFRTMSLACCDAADSHVVEQATQDDYRVTRVGRFLRRSSLDELPQLINVLRGDMSLVGPRPHAVAHDKYYSTFIAAYYDRNIVRPGMTGWAQIHGFRGKTETADEMRRRVEMDIIYINTWSLSLDIYILCRTLGVILNGRNAY